MPRPPESTVRTFIVIVTGQLEKWQDKETERSAK